MLIPHPTRNNSRCGWAVDYAASSGSPRWTFVFGPDWLRALSVGRLLRRAEIRRRSYRAGVVDGQVQVTGRPAGVAEAAVAGNAQGLSVAGRGRDADVNVA